MNSNTQQLLNDLQNIDIAIEHNMIQTDASTSAKYILRVTVAMLVAGIRGGDESIAEEAITFIDSMKRQYVS